MSHAKPPTIAAEEGYRVELRRVFGSPNFKHSQTITLLGWSADETSLRVLDHNRRGWLQRWDVRLGMAVETIEVSPRPATVARPLGAGRAIVRAKTGDRAAPAAIEVWDLDAGRREEDVPADSAVNGLLASEDGRVLVVNDGGRSIVRALPGGARLGDVLGKPFAVAADGARFATRVRGADRALKVWTARGKALATVAFEDGRELVSAAFSRDGDALLVGRSDGAVECRDVATGALRWSATLHDGGVLAIARSPAGVGYFTLGNDARLCAVSPDGGLRWGSTLARWIDVESAQILPSPSGAAVAVSGLGVGLRFFDAATGVERSTVDGHLGEVSCLGVSSDGRLVASGGHDGDARVNDVATGETVWTLEVSPRMVESVEFSRGGSALRTCGSDGVARRWDLARGFEEGRVGAPSPWDAQARELPDGSGLLIVGFDRLQRRSEGSSGEVVWARGVGGTLDGTHNERWYQAETAFWPDASRVAVATGTATYRSIATFDTATGECVVGAVELSGRFLGLSETDEGPVSITSDENSVQLTEEWGSRSGRKVPAWTEGLRRAGLSADRRWLVTTADQRIDVWDLSGPALRPVGRVDLTALDDALTALALSPRGDVLAVGTRRGCVLTFALGADA